MHNWLYQSLLLIFLAKNQPELVQFKDISADQVLIREGCENDEVLSKLKNRREICVFSPKKSRVRAKSLVSLLLCHYDASHTVPI